MINRTYINPFINFSGYDRPTTDQWKDVQPGTQAILTVEGGGDPYTIDRQVPVTILSVDGHQGRTVRGMHVSPKHGGTILPEHDWVDLVKYVGPDGPGELLVGGFLETGIPDGAEFDGVLIKNNKQYYTMAFNEGHQTSEETEASLSKGRNNPFIITSIRPV